MNERTNEWIRVPEHGKITIILRITWVDGWMDVDFVCVDA